MPAWEMNSPVFISSVCLMADAEQEMALWGGRGALGGIIFLLCVCASVYMYLLCVIIPYGHIFIMHNIICRQGIFFLRNRDRRFYMQMWINQIVYLQMRTSKPKYNSAVFWQDTQCSLCLMQYVFVWLSTTLWWGLFITKRSPVEILPLLNLNISIINSQHR